MNATVTKHTNRSAWLTFFVLFFSIFVLVSVTCTLITFILPESFASKARFKVERTEAIPQAGRNSTGEVENYDARLVLTESEVIQSESILAQVIEALDLNTEWGKRYLSGGKLKTAESLALLKSRLEVRPCRGTNVIEVQIFSENPNEAATLANAITKLYAERAAQIKNGLQVTIIDSAHPSARPARPNKPLNIMVGMMLGAVLGVLIGGVFASILAFVHSRKQRSPPPVP